MNREVSFDDGSSVEDRIDERCDAFELAWQNGKRPSIVDFIGPEDAGHRNTLFCELLLVELECRRSLGEEPAEDEYLQDFPEFAAQIHATKFRHGAAAFSTARVSGEKTPPTKPREGGSQIAHFELVERLVRAAGARQSFRQQHQVVRRRDDRAGRLPLLDAAMHVFQSFGRGALARADTSANNRAERPPHGEIVLSAQVDGAVGVLCSRLQLTTKQVQSGGKAVSHRHVERMRELFGESDGAAHRLHGAIRITELPVRP